MPSRRVQEGMGIPSYKAWKIHCQSRPSNFKENGMPPIRSQEGLAFPKEPGLPERGYAYYMFLLHRVQVRAS